MFFSGKCVPGCDQPATLLTRMSDGLPLGRRQMLRPVCEVHVADGQILARDLVEQRNNVSLHFQLPTSE